MTNSRAPQARCESDKPRVISVLGGPGSGKGTQCQWLARNFKVQHISVGEVLRAEINRPGSPHADIIRQNMLTGTFGPKEITVEILKSHILRSMQQGTCAFVLDGFPRSLEQFRYFEQVVGPIDLMVLLQCSESVLIERLLPRGRFDDNLETIQSRLRTFEEVTTLLIDEFRQRDKLQIIDGEETVEEVHDQLKLILSELVEVR
ncbi:hypothetical protein NM208_g3780 [Fusarium decemcellulare]|uniref:Uncharacterized protein n=1 Tax=Fusarium decemcellulare TaxID=57161 RepID=A0ACC1SMZ7_9HYPO|nr:hypothetical protein NM208_g3780 [Fusarium decemcellulare]